MTITLTERPELIEIRPRSGGAPARRALTRWSWRLFRHEWRQQILILILTLITMAVAATVIGATVAVNASAPAHAGFGSVQDLATFQGSRAQLAADVATVRDRFGRIDVIENRTLSVPGSIDTYDLRTQDPHGAFGQSMLALVSGHFPWGRTRSR
ncbi:MAG: hypothetical protein ACRDY1_00440 [Acidimicrobiales bacterium]